MRGWKQLFGWGIGLGVWACLLPLAVAQDPLVPRPGWQQPAYLFPSITGWGNLGPDVATPTAQRAKFSVAPGEAKGRGQSKSLTEVRTGGANTKKAPLGHMTELMGTIDSFVKQIAAYSVEVSGLNGEYHQDIPLAMSEPPVISAGNPPCDVRFVPFGVFVANVNYNRHALVPGSFAAFAVPDIDLVNEPQFQISPGNTLLGVNVMGPTIDQFEIGGRLDFNLRGPEPLLSDNRFLPQLLELFGEARSQSMRILIGQAHDVISPLTATSLNQYPISIMPGSLGYYRPQVRLEWYQHAWDDLLVTYQGSINQTMQTLEAEAGVFGRQAGWPDLQGRVAVGVGLPDEERRRPLEAGFWGHIGERVLARLPFFEKRHFQTWSVGADVRWEVTPLIEVSGEWFMGQLLGSYAGGAFQDIDPVRGIAIGSNGGWIQIGYRPREYLAFHVGYGVDDPHDSDLAPGSRSLNTRYFANIFYEVSRQLTLALEFTRWKTNWIALPDGESIRIESAVIYQF